MTTRLSTLALSAALIVAAGTAWAEDLRIGFADPVSAIDPELNNYAGDHSVAQHFFPAIVAQKTIGGMVPGLAESWKNTSPTTWEFKIRDKAVWTDGQPVTADDIAFSYQRAQSVPGSVASFKSFLRSVAKVEVKDPHTLVITTKAPDPLLPINLSSIYVVSKHVGQTATTDDYNSGKAMVTDGPYAFVSYTPGDRIEMKRNDTYWGPKAQWDKVSYRYIANPAARTAALLSGDVDMIDKVSFSDIEKLEKNPKVKVWSYPGLRVLILHGSKAETKNVDQEGTEDTLKFREIVQSTIEYDQRRSSIAVGSKSATDAKKLVKIFGDHVLGDGDIFEASAKDELYTLAPLQGRGAAFKFDFQPDGEITHVALREVRVDEAQLTTTGRLRRSPWYLTLGDTENALRRLKDVAPEIDVADVRIVHAKIDVTIEVDDSEIVVPVTIRPPRTVSMRDHSHERLILEMLEDNEIRKRRRTDQAAAAAE